VLAHVFSHLRAPGIEAARYEGFVSSTTGSPLRRHVDS
jgi:hypothetical protein